MDTTELDTSYQQPKPNLTGAWRIVYVRGIRSFTQSFLNIVTPLYLLSKGVSAAELGVFFTLSFLIGALMSIPVGVFADRWGRKPFLVAFTVLMLIWGAVFTFTNYLPLMIIISVISGIGRGGGGMGGGQAGPFAPAEQALLADLAPESERRKVFSWNGVTSSLMAAAGAALVVLPVLLERYYLF
ncbi:MAG: MFS transporter, partial [Acidimicrobiaceae bacterium]|nr:MFS transporter [Acidimicrobiaceae bacterium]